MQSKALRALKIIAITFSVLVIVALIVLFAASYKAISVLTSKPQAATEAVDTETNGLQTNEVKPISTDAATTVHATEATKTPQKKRKLTEHEFVATLLATEKLASIDHEIAEKTVPDICHNLCSESQFDPGKGSGLDKIHQVISFYEQEGLRAFDDPRFYLTYELVQVTLIRLFSDSSRKFMIEVQEFQKRKEEPSGIEKVRLTLRAQQGIFGIITDIKRNAPQLRVERQHLQKMIKLRKRCPDESRSEIEKICREIKPR